MKKNVIVIGVLILAMVTVCVGISVVAFFTFSPFRMNGFKIGPVEIATVSATATEQKTFQVKRPATLDLKTPFGDIDITGGDTDEIKVTANKTAWGANQKSAEEALKKIQLKMVQDGDKITIEVEQPNTILSNGNSSSVDFIVTVPTSTTVIASSESGEIKLAETQGKADLSSSFGSIEVNDLKGGLAMQTNSGALRARRISLLESGDGDIQMQTDFGDVTLEDVQTERVTASSRSGGLELTDVDVSGDLKLNSDFGDIEYTTGKAGQLEAETRSGGITIREVKVEKDATVKSNFGDVELRDVIASSYDLESGNGGVTAQGVHGKLKVRTNSGTIEITQGEDVVLDLESQMGEIIFKGNLGDGGHRLATDFGDIQMTLPEDSAFNFDLQTEFGDIDSKFKTVITGEPKESHWVGQVNGGGNKITAFTKNGSISLLTSGE